MKFNFMQIFGIIILALLACYYLFYAINTLSLPTQTGLAKVAKKEYKPAGTSYQNTYIETGGRQQVLVRPVATPEMYLVTFDLNGKKAVGAFSKEEYDRLAEGERVNIQYQKRRITGALQVVGLVK